MSKRKKRVVLPKKNLGRMAVEPLSTPFPNKNSVSRLSMYKSALGHSVAPADNPETPLVDSIYSSNIIYSSDNYESKGRVTLLDRVQKEIDGVVTEVTYIYFEEREDGFETTLPDGTTVKGLIDMEMVPIYEKYYRFGYEIKSELEDMEIGETSDDTIFTRYYYNVDREDGAMAYGKNIKFIYNVGRDVGEDSITITHDLAQKLALNFYDEVRLIYSPKVSILKNLYGFNTEDGRRVYRPFPLPGETITKDAVVCWSTIGANFIALTNEIEDADHVKYVHEGSRVVDIEVYSNDPIENGFLEELRIYQKKYISAIRKAINTYRNDPVYKNLISDSLEYKARRFDNIQNDLLRVESDLLDDKIYVKIKIINKSPLRIGSKITNRDGGKGTIGTILPPGVDIVVERTGMKLDAIMNATGVFNRENPAQLFEKEINSCNYFLMEYLNTTKDNTNIKFNNIITWCEKAKLHQDMIDLLRKAPKRDVVELFSSTIIPKKYDPYESHFGLYEIVDLSLFTKSINSNTGPETIRIGDTTLSESHTPGVGFYLVLENGDMKDTSIRSDGITNIKGSLRKKGASRKNHQSKWGSTAPKVSDLGVAIMLNMFKFTDTNLMKSNMKILNDYLEGLGVTFKQRRKEDGQEY